MLVACPSNCAIVKRSFFQGINLLLRELDQFVAELFLIVRFHEMTSRRSGIIGMTG